MSSHASLDGLFHRYRSNGASKVSSVRPLLPAELPRYYLAYGDDPADAAIFFRSLLSGERV
jgi:hypothetical protein